MKLSGQILILMLLSISLTTLGKPVFSPGSNPDGTGAELHTVSFDTVLMGSAFILTAVHESDTTAWEAIRAGINEIIRIESLISSWDEQSETSEINRQAGVEPVAVSEELFQLIKRSLKVSDLSDGYFDISFASAERFWKFDKRSIDRPDEASVRATVRKVGYENIELNEERKTVFLKEAGMRIGFGAIGKGYAANRVRAIMKEAGIQSGVVNAGGDLLAWGRRPDGKVWTIGVANPDEIYEVKAWLDLTDMAVVTSGNYEKYVMIDGVRYGHIIDPKTGWPAQGLTSVTLVCPDAELADALATTVFVLGLEGGLDLVNQLRGIEAILIDDQGSLHYSTGIKERILLNGN